MKPTSSADDIATAAAASAQRLLDALPSSQMIVPRRRRREYEVDEAQSRAAGLLRAVPPKFRDCTSLEEASKRLHFPAEEIVSAAQRLFDRTLTTVTIAGPGAAGKTSAAALLIGELARLVVKHPAVEIGTIVWCSSNELALEADYSDPRDGEPELARRARTAPILILDDLGNEKGQRPGSNNVGAGILQVRYDLAETTIVTVGFTSAEITAKFGVGLARRLADLKDPRHLLTGVRRGGK